MMRIIKVEARNSRKILNDRRINIHDKKKDETKWNYSNYGSYNAKRDGKGKNSHT